MALEYIVTNTEWSVASPSDFADMMPYEIGRNILLPFILTFMVFWAFLDKINIFNNRINIVLSLGICILLATTPTYTTLALLITQFGGSSMIILFGVLLVGGSLMWTLGRGKDIYYEHSPDKKLAEYDRRIKKAYKRNDLNAVKKLEEARDEWYRGWRNRQDKYNY